MSAPVRSPGRPVEPNSIRSEAKRRGVTPWQVRVERAGSSAAVTKRARITRNECDGPKTRSEPPIEDGSTPANDKPEVSRKPANGG